MASEAIIAAGIGAAGSIAAGTGSAIAAGNLNKKNREWQQEEAERQRAWNEQMYNAQNAWNYEMWQKENEYNTPENQLQRLRDAGLNPLFYGLDGNSSGSPQAAAQPLGYERASAFNQVNPIAAGVDSALKVAQVSNVQANTAKATQETLSEVQKREKTIAEIDEIRQEIKNKIATEKLTDTQRERLEKDLSWLDRLNEATLDEKKSAAALSKSQKNRIEELLEGEKIIQAKTAQDFDEKWKKIHAEIAKIAGENAILAKDLENYALNHANNGFMGTGLSLNNLFRLGHEADKDKTKRPPAGSENKFGNGTDWQDIARSGQ